MEPGIIFQSLLFGVFGTAYFVYGKKQQRFYFLASGVALMLIPYFIENIWLLASVGIALLLAPIMIK